MYHSILKTVCIIFISFAARPLSGQSEPVAWTTDQVQQILKNRIDVEKQGVGIVVGLVNQKGKQIISYGSVNKDSVASKPDGETVFEIGSATKVFTSLLLADMVGRGEVALSDPVSKFLPKTVKMPSRNGREITLLDLATHTSALPRMPTNFAPADSQNPYADYTVDNMYAFLSGCKLTSNIGEKYEYSNLGAGLLGHVLALRAGTDFETLVATRICKPLGMTSTSITLTPDMKKRLAVGHDETLSQVKNWDLNTLAGAGAIRSTANDMVRFVEANMGKTKTNLYASMKVQHATRAEAGDPNKSIGLGWHKLASPSSEVVWHNGQTGGYHSFVGFDKKRGVGVVVLANAALDIDDIGKHLLDSEYALQKISPKKERKTIQVDSKILDSYVGEYELIPTFVISITKEENRLMLQATGQPKFEIFAESEEKFFLKVVDAQITFVRGAKGLVTELILHQGGANQHAKKRLSKKP